MDDLCNFMDYLLPLLDKSEEYCLLTYSDSLSLEELASSHFLKKNVNRYRRYIKYINFSDYNDGELILVLLQDYLENLDSRNIILAAKCKVIDAKIVNMLKFIVTSSESDSEMEFAEPDY